MIYIDTLCCNEQIIADFPASIQIDSQFSFVYVITSQQHQRISLIT